MAGEQHNPGFESAAVHLWGGRPAAQCGGSDRGYIGVPQTRSFGANTWLVPVISIIGPS